MVHRIFTSNLRFESQSNPGVITRKSKSVFRYISPTLTSNLLHRHLENPMQTLEAMLRPKVATLPGHIQAVYVQNAAKLFATVLKSQEGNTNSTAAQETSQLMIDRLPVFVQSANLEVQERVSWIDFFFFFFSSGTAPACADLHLCPASPVSSQASCILQLVKYIQKLQQKDVEVAEEVSALFAGELNPVAPKAQKKVPVPEG